MWQPYGRVNLWRDWGAEAMTTFGTDPVPLIEQATELEFAGGVTALLGRGVRLYAHTNKKSRPLTSAQIRAGRGLLRWSATNLAREAALGLATIKRAESAENETSMTAANDLAVRRALESAASSSSTRTAGALEYACESGNRRRVRVCGR